jgi:Zn-dependent M28 family amino/carboxypeptidase
MKMSFIPLFIRTLIFGLFLLIAVAAWFAWNVIQPFVASQATPFAPQADATALRRHVTKLSTELSPRPYDNLINLNLAADYIASQWRELGLKVIEQPYQVSGASYKNLIVELGPDTEDIMVIGAHYDVAGEQPGADDNASGVAGLIELARLLKPLPLKKRVQLVAWTLEEPPFFRTPQMGSAIHAKSLKAAGKNVSLMFSLECIGYFSDLPNTQTFPLKVLSLAYPTTGNFIALVGQYKEPQLTRGIKRAMSAASTLPVYSISAPSFVKGVDFSDQLNFWNEGYTGYMITDTAFFRNEAYHKSADTPDRLDYKRMAMVVDGVLSATMFHAAVR